MDIRAARPEDVAGIGRVHALSRNAAYVDLLPADALASVTPARQAEYWRLRLDTEAEPHAAYVATVDGEVQGFTVGKADGVAATLDAIHVLPALHGSGAGQALHDRLLADFRSWGCREASLWVLEGNERAQSFYRRNGWTHDGERGRHSVGGVEAAVLRYRRPLTPEKGQLFEKTAGPPSGSSPDDGPRPAQVQA